MIRYEYRSSRGSVLAWRGSEAAPALPPITAGIAPRFQHSFRGRGFRARTFGQAQRALVTLSALTAINITETTVQFRVTVTF